MQNPHTNDIDQITTDKLLQLMNREDHRMLESVRNVIPVITQVVEHLAPLVKRGGRLIYLGAGTSGRLGVLDASEIPPTFSAPENQFVGLIAGGDTALRKALESSEDNEMAAAKDLQPLNLNPELDTVLGIASSGRTPYVIGALRYAKSLGCVTVGLSCVHDPEIGKHGLSDFLISPVTGPEVVTGSTRLKAGTATKLVLNMISTATMIKIGKTYGNLMVDLRPTNIKLRERTRNIFKQACGGEYYIVKEGIISKFAASPTDLEENKFIDHILDYSQGNLKLAILVAKRGVDIYEADKMLAKADGNLREALQQSGTREQLPISKMPPTKQFDKYNLCIDILTNEIQVVLFNKRTYIHKQVMIENLGSDLSETIDKCIEEISCNQHFSSNMLESIKVGTVSGLENTILNALFLNYGIDSSRVAILSGQSDLCGLVLTLFNR
ncbi:N-acetylmuramic acid-6-phosphate etherase [Yamadazyma tenuis]|nr:N-acetylmuramic acid-6-phosphate etherase [Yamadazyma tenuis]